MGICFLYDYLKNDLQKYVIVLGKIVGFHKELDDGGTSFSPIFEYEYEGTVYQKRHRFSSAKFDRNRSVVPSGKYNIGDEISVRVFTNRPEDAIINDRSNLNMPLICGLICLFLGLVFSIVSGFFLLS